MTVETLSTFFPILPENPLYYYYTNKLKTMRTINNKTNNKEQLDLVRNFFTNEQWDIIDYALSEYQDHDEAADLCNDTQTILSDLFQAPYDS